MCTPSALEAEPRGKIPNDLGWDILGCSDILLCIFNLLKIMYVIFMIYVTIYVLKAVSIIFIGSACARYILAVTTMPAKPPLSVGR